jgi:3-hydroxyacyl-CoA dehydrogenase / enoyl-CoA hydratase / 3-hydroxybutyryl-CoA epimerase
MEKHAILRKIERAGMDPKTLKGGKPIACRPARHRRRHRLRASAGLPPHLRGRQPQGQDRPARDHGRHLPRRAAPRALRKMGAMAAAPFLLEGKMSDPAKAKAAGLVDEVVPAAKSFWPRAKDWVLNATDADIVKPWDQKGYKMPGGAPYHPRAS